MQSEMIGWQRRAAHCADCPDTGERWTMMAMKEPIASLYPVAHECHDGYDRSRVVIRAQIARQRRAMANCLASDL